MALLDPAFPSPGQVVEHGAEVLLDLPEDRFLPVLRYENHMIFAIPCGMVQVMLLRHSDLLVGIAVPLGESGDKASAEGGKVNVKARTRRFRGASARATI